MRDETRLAADVYLTGPRRVQPATGKPSPRFWFAPRTTKPSNGSSRGSSTPISSRRKATPWSSRTYAGATASEGSFYHGVTEGVDGYDTIEWIATSTVLQRQGRHDRNVLFVGGGGGGRSHTTAAPRVHVSREGAVQLLSQRVSVTAGALRLFKVPSTLAFMMSGQLALADPTVMSSASRRPRQPIGWERCPSRAGLALHSPSTPSMKPGFSISRSMRTTTIIGRASHAGRPMSISAGCSTIPQFYLGGWYDTYREDTFYIGLAGRHHGALRLMMGPWTGMDLDGARRRDLFRRCRRRLPPDRVQQHLCSSWFDSTMGESARRHSFEDVHPWRSSSWVVAMGSVDEAGRVNHGGRWRSEMEWPLSRATA